jgi:hypothetical protein
MVSAISSWFSHPALLWGLGIFSVVAVVASVLLVPRYLASLPQDFLVSDGHQEGGSMAWRVARNVLGVLLVVLGVLMLILPGQGLLTLLVGVMLVDFPGKLKLVQRLLARPKVLSVVNKLRGKHGKPPLTS